MWQETMAWPWQHQKVADEISTRKTGNADTQKSELWATFPENLAMRSVTFRVPFLGSKSGPKTGLESYPFQAEA